MNRDWVMKQLDWADDDDKAETTGMDAQTASDIFLLHISCVRSSLDKVRYVRIHKAGYDASTHFALLKVWKGKHDFTYRITIGTTPGCPSCGEGRLRIQVSRHDKSGIIRFGSGREFALKTGQAAQADIRALVKEVEEDIETHCTSTVEELLTEFNLNDKDEQEDGGEKEDTGAGTGLVPATPPQSVLVRTGSKRTPTAGRSVTFQSSSLP